MDQRLEKRLLRDAGKAIADFRMIEAGDRILVGISGGKDSFTLLHLLQQLQRSAPVRFELVACNLDQGHPGFPAADLERYLRATGAEVLMLREDTFSVVKRLLGELESEHPGVRASLLGAMGNVMPEHLLDARLRRDESGADPWLDGDDCSTVVQLPRARRANQA